MNKGHGKYLPCKVILENQLGKGSPQNSSELTNHCVTSVKNSLAGPPRSTTPSEVPMSSVNFTQSLFWVLDDFQLRARLVPSQM